jgi:hypothetical protein
MYKQEMETADTPLKELQVLEERHGHPFIRL